MIETTRWFEGQKYMAMTSHQWSSVAMMTSTTLWDSLPSDIQSIVVRNQAKYAELERHDAALGDAATADLMKRQGLTFNRVDSQSWRPRLADFYRRWKVEFGTTAWDQLEASVGKLT